MRRWSQEVCSYKVPSQLFTRVSALTEIKPPECGPRLPRVTGVVTTHTPTLYLTTVILIQSLKQCIFHQLHVRTLAYHKVRTLAYHKVNFMAHKNQTHLNDSLSFSSWKDKRDLMSLYQASRNTQAVDNVSKVMPYSTNNGIITHPCVEVSMQHPYAVELSNCVHIM